MLNSVEHIVAISMEKSIQTVILLVILLFFQLLFKSCLLLGVHFIGQTLGLYADCAQYMVNAIL